MISDVLIKMTPGDINGLAQKKCIPCEGDTPPLKEPEIKELLKEIPFWLFKSGHLYRSFRFKNFQEALDFVNATGRIAEEEGHHPDISVHYNKVELDLWTHAIKGLSENDFILAAKIDRLINKNATLAA